MHKKFKISVGDLRTSIAVLILLIFGSMMVASAEMGNSAGDASYLLDVTLHQIGFAVVGVAVYFTLINIRVLKLSLLVASILLEEKSPVWH